MAKHDWMYSLIVDDSSDRLGIVEEEQGCVWWHKTYQWFYTFTQWEQYKVFWKLVKTS